MRWNLSVAALAASWGLISVIVAGVDLAATTLVFFRLALAALTLGALALVTTRTLAVPPAVRVRLVVVACILAVHWFLFFETIKLSSVAVAVLTVYTAPVFLAWLAPLLLPERRSRVALVALAPAATGIVLIALAGEGGTHARPLAIATGLGAAFTYALLVIGTKSLTSRLHAITIAFWQDVVAALALLPFLLTAERVLPESAFDLGALLLLGVVFTGVSGYVYISLLKRVTAQAVGILALLEPVAAALLAWAILGESLGAAVVAGGALVLAAGMLVVLAEPGDAAAVEAGGLGSAAE